MGARIEETLHITDVCVYVRERQPTFEICIRYTCYRETFCISDVYIREERSVLEMYRY